MALTRAEYMTQVHEHVHRFFEGHEAWRREFSDERIQEVVPGFHVIEVAPGPKLRLTTYVSVGAGFPDEPEQSNHEFLLAAEQPAARHVELLAMVAHYHWTGERLGVEHLFGIGEPWVEGSTLEHMLVSLPYPYGPDLEVLETPERCVHLLWLQPITAAERTYAKQHGVEALEERFEKAKLKYWHPRRKSVV